MEFKTILHPHEIYNLSIKEGLENHEFQISEVIWKETDQRLRSRERANNFM